VPEFLASSLISSFTSRWYITKECTPYWGNL